MELPFLKPPKLHNAPVIILVSFLIPVCYTLYLVKNFSHQPYEDGIGELEGKCEIFKGEWVPNPEAPFYTNTTCWAIHEHQNCMKYGRPDSGFIHWKWKPFGCQLPAFDPLRFLDIVRGKSMAFVGDSIARNHLQSLICLLSTVEYPIDISSTRDEKFKRWRYESYNFTVAAFWSPYLVKAHLADPKGPTLTGLFSLHLDQFDTEWTAQIQQFHYLIISAGHWFLRPSIYYENNQIVGCRYCLLPNVTDLPTSYGYKRAFRTAFRAINENENYEGVIFLRTFAPSHFENGEWDKGGNCLRSRPYDNNEIKLEGFNLELYMAQLEEFEKAENEGRKRGLKYKLMDITRAMLFRGDGHPSRYGHWPNQNVTLYNDCVHWCLPGPIDTWNDFLLQMLDSEVQHNLISSDTNMKFVT